jgi:hypothetical protein
MNLFKMFRQVRIPNFPGNQSLVIRFGSQLAMPIQAGFIGALMYHPLQISLILMSILMSVSMPKQICLKLLWLI